MDNEEANQPAQTEENGSMDVFSNEAEQHNENNNQQQDSGGSQQTNTPSAEETKPVTQQDLKTLIEGLRNQNQPQQQQPVQQPQQAQTSMTQEEIDSRLGRVNVTPDMLRGVLGVDGTPEQAQNLQKILDGVAHYALRSAHYLQQGVVRQNEAALSKLNEQLTPLQQQYRQQQDEVLAKEFFGINKDLVGFEPLAKEVYESMVAKGVKFNTKDEAFNAIATQTKQLMTKLNLSSNGGAAQAQTPRQATSPRMASTGMTSISGNGGGRNQPTSKSEALSVFN